MKKNFRIFKTIFIFGLLLFSIFTVFSPQTSAGIIKVKPLITVQYPITSENVVPNSGVLLISLKTTFELTGIGASALTTYSLLKDSPISIELKVESKESWVDASIDNPLASLKLQGTEGWTSTLKITVTENAPALSLGKVTISATSKEQSGLLFSVAKETYYFDVSFVVGYWPVVNYELPKGNLVEIGPLDTADFEISLQNLGNGITYVGIEPVEIPEGDWTVNIASSIILASPIQNVERAKATVHLVIKPPYGFGLHKDVKTFKVRLTPQYLGNPDLPTGNVETITFTVQSVGLSPGIGFEIPLIVIIIVIIAIVIYLYRRRLK